MGADVSRVTYPRFECCRVNRDDVCSRPFGLYLVSSGPILQKVILYLLIDDFWLFPRLSNPCTLITDAHKSASSKTDFAVL